MSGIGVILNPHSRSNRANPERMQRLAFIVGDKGSCHMTQDVLDVKTVAEEFAQREIEVLCISGGDGTIHHTISTVIHAYGDRPLPMIALLFGGTVNNVANAVGMKGTPESILSQIILRYHEGRSLDTTPVHCLDVNGHYGFLFGNGFVHNFISEYIRVGEGGNKNIFRLMAKMIGSAIMNGSYMLRLARRFDAKVLLDGKEWAYKNYCALQAGTVEPLGVGFEPFSRAREKPDHFHMIGYSMPPRQIVREFIYEWLGRPQIPAYTLNGLAHEAVIDMKEPGGFMIDGEIYPPTDRIVLRCGPALQMVRV
jgi:diacylglycerol kinase family enzyme